MPKHIVKCPKCGVEFDTNEIQAVRVGARRYGHASCYKDITDFVPLAPKQEKKKKEPKTEDKDMTKLKDYINQVYSDKANWPLIMRQIKKFTTENQYSLTGILKSLVWFYEVQHNNVDGSNGGIGIVEYAYQPAYQYYLSLFMAQQANEGKTLSHEIKEIVIQPPAKRGTRQCLIELEEFDNEEQSLC